MKITLRKIDRTNYNECIELRVGDGQTKFVAPNEYSLVQAAYEPNMYPLAIYGDEQMIGFILYDLDEALSGWSMSRFMIDAAYQHQGFGKQALTQFLAYFKTNHPDVRAIYTSAEVENPVAISMYKKAGFEAGDVFTYEASGNQYTEIRMLLSL